MFVYNTQNLQFYTQPIYKQRTRLAYIVDSSIHWLNQYPLHNSINFDSTFPPDSDYPPSFEPLGSGGLFLKSPETFRAYFVCINSCYIFATPFSFSYFKNTLKDQRFKTGGLHFRARRDQLGEATRVVTIFGTCQMSTR